MGSVCQAHALAGRVMVPAEQLLRGRWIIANRESRKAAGAALAGPAVADGRELSEEWRPPPPEK